MMRRIAGWCRIETEDKSITMKRMRNRLDQGQRLLYCENLSIRFARNQCRYIHNLMESYPLFWTQIMWKFNVNPSDDQESDFLPHRSPGHIRMRWDDHVHSFSHKVWLGTIYELLIKLDL